MTPTMYFDSPLGLMMAQEHNGAIIALDFVQAPQPDDIPAETPLLLEAKRQVLEYFAGKRRDFDLPLAPKGTPFQLRVWQALRAIPYGQTRSYGQIAAAVGNPKAGRAVGGANHRNPISLVQPCHRVIGSSGRLVGYGGGLDKKEALLALERRVSADTK
jgi:methylated-DNA-[protein]-cysteine S-methyltransferase